ncbi:MAG TPA: hypothetical protein VFN21_07050 [Acidimicrobiales bacterium]|nr:hypothetical protein [Acidimicrobiales bacterium]
MSDVLIRNVPSDDLDLIRTAAAADGLSMQQYLMKTLQAQARFLRRRDTLEATAHRVREWADVTESERRAVLDEMAAQADERAAELGDRVVR